jgi:hypothetical protein
MSRKSVAPKQPTTNAHEDFLNTVEASCTRAAAIMRDTVNVVLGLEPKDAPTAYAVALDHVAGELEAISERALKVRTAGGAA